MFVAKKNGSAVVVVDKYAEVASVTSIECRLSPVTRGDGSRVEGLFKFFIEDADGVSTPVSVNLDTAAPIRIGQLVTLVPTVGAEIILIALKAPKQYKTKLGTMAEDQGVRVSADTPVKIG